MARRDADSDSDVDLGGLPMDLRGHDRLAGVLEAIERIERHTSAGREAFGADELVQI